MSVIQSERKLSTVQFITSARDLLNVVVRTCARIPKKYTFYGLIHAYNLAQSIVDDLVRGNTVYLNTVENYNKRKNYFDNALENLNCLSMHISYLKEYAEIEEKYWIKISSLIETTQSLVKKIKTSDKERMGV